MEGFSSRENHGREEPACTAFTLVTATISWEMVSAAKSKLTSCPHYTNALIDGPDLV